MAMLARKGLEQGIATATVFVQVALPPEHLQALATLPTTVQVNVQVMHFHHLFSKKMIWGIPRNGIFVHSERSGHGGLHLIFDQTFSCNLPLDSCAEPLWVSVLQISPAYAPPTTPPPFQVSKLPDRQWNQAARSKFSEDASNAQRSPCIDAIKTRHSKSIPPLSHSLAG